MKRLLKKSGTKQGPEPSAFDPTSVEPSLPTLKDTLDWSSLAGKICQALAALARADGVVTVDEYLALCTSAESLAAVTDNPGLVRVMILEALTSDLSPATALTEMRNALKNEPEDVRKAVGEAARPLVDLQTDTQIANEWRAALGLPREGQPPSTLHRFKTAFRFFRTDSKENDKLSRWRELAAAFQDEQLESIIMALEQEEELTRVEAELELARERILARALQLLPERALLEARLEAAERFFTLAESLVDQARHRLRSIAERLEFQQDCFREDLESFIDRAVDLVDLGMRDLVERVDDWTDPTLWGRFAETQAAQILKSQFTALKDRYERMFRMWDREFSLFSGELQQTSESVLDSMDPRAFAGLVRPTGLGVQAAKSMDQLAEATLATAGVAAAGTGVLIATGVTTTQAVLVAAGAALSSPVGITIGAVLAIASIWKFLAKPDQRKRAVMLDRRKALRQGLQSMLETGNESWGRGRPFQARSRRSGFGGRCATTCRNG